MPGATYSKAGKVLHQKEGNFHTFVLLFICLAWDEKLSCPACNCEHHQKLCTNHAMHKPFVAQQGQSDQLMGHAILKQVAIARM